MPARLTLGSVTIVVGTACSDRDEPPSANWIIGSYSTFEPGFTTNDQVDQFHFAMDFNVRIIEMGISGPRTQTTHPWEARDEDTVAIVDLEGYSNDKEILVFGSRGCEALSFRSVRESGSERNPRPLYRAEVCVRVDEEVIGQGYERFWCSEPPEPCEDESDT